jgi:hypothetical protein
VSRLRINRKSTRQLRIACASLVLISAGVSLFACSDSLETASHYEPARLEPIKGTEVKRVEFSAEGAKRVGLQTAEIRANGQRKVIPYAAVIYDPEGNTYTYTSSERLTFVRQEIEIDRVNGDRVVLSEGPPAGTEVVTVGAAEVYGTEFEVAH